MGTVDIVIKTRFAVGGGGGGCVWHEMTLWQDVQEYLTITTMYGILSQKASFC